MEKLPIDNLKQPPEKVVLMYQAVAKLMKKNHDVNQLTVEDITRSAGIGKGTAYEYFSTKDELIACALIYDIFGKLRDLGSKVKTCGGFREKMNCLFDWVQENRDYNQTNWHIVQIFMGKFESCESLRRVIPGNITDGVYAYLKEEGDALLESGWKEGIYTEQDPYRRRLAFLTAMVEYSMCLAGQQVHPLPMTDEELRKFVYESMVRALQI